MSEVDIPYFQRDFTVECSLKQTNKKKQQTPSVHVQNKNC